ncbi:MAG: class I SAM-dependent methyltransferase [Bacteroidales bacterium]|nr:class I SAM-dependent methyltransferase [Bacteroidales bacterium]
MSEFDDKALTWDLDEDKIKRAKAVAQEIRKFIIPGQKLNALEFGCGTGLLSVELKEDFRSIILADTSQGMISVLKRKIQKGKFKHLIPMLIDNEAKGLLSYKFDVVYSLMTLHHIPDIHRIVQFFHTIIKLGGLLFIIDLDKEDGSFHQGQNFEGHLGFEKNDIEELFRKSGFNPVHYSICYTIHKKAGTSTKEFPLFMIVGEKVKG